MKVELLLCVAAILASAADAVDEDVIVTTNFGKIRGTTTTATNGKTIYSFKNIPFAKPPARFQASQPLNPDEDSWGDEIRDGTKNSPSCAQYLTNLAPVSEDCLYLNVHMPMDHADSEIIANYSLNEPSGCSRTDGKRPDGMTLIPWKTGRCLVWDFTCRDTYAASYLPTSSSSLGHPSSLAEIHKHNIYRDLENRFIVSIIAVETSGVFGDEGLRLLKSIGHRISESTGDNRATSFLLQRVSLAIQRGNTASILGTLPPGKELYEIYLL